MILTDAEVLGEFRKKVKRFPTQDDAAKDLGVSSQYLSELVTGKKPLTDHCLQWAGYRRIIRYASLPHRRKR